MSYWLHESRFSNVLDLTVPSVSVSGVAEGVPCFWYVYSHSSGVLEGAVSYVKVVELYVELPNVIVTGPWAKNEAFFASEPNPINDPGPRTYEFVNLRRCY